MSDSQLKPIKINPELFTLGPRSVKNKTLKKTNTNIQPNKLKQNLLSKIKNYRKNKLSGGNDESEPIIISNPDVKINKMSETKPNMQYKPTHSKPIQSESSIDDDFTQSINYLKNLSTKREKPSSHFPLPSLNNIKENNKPEYGCMKNGSLPTYREWKNKTLKKPISNTIINTDANMFYDKKSIIETEKDIEKNIEKDLEKDLEKDIEKDLEKDNLENKRHKYKLSKRSTTLKYHLGKRGRSVGVLVKNATTRKKIIDEHNLLRQTKLSDMKNYLKRHNLLKSGSRAPPDIIKKMYEQSLLGGDIRNSNKNNVIHNYLAE
jgi:hypothetical protein